jgi:TolB-like protein
MKKLLAVVLLLLLAGCCDVATYSDAKRDPFIATNYKAADALIASANAKGQLKPGTILLVATVVDVDKLTESSRLGRIVSEQLRARLTQSGYAVVETELRGSLQIKKDTGELLLSRDLKDVGKTYNAQAVVVGTYAVASKYVYISLKVIGDDNNALGAYDYALPLNRNVWKLLQQPGASEPNYINKYNPAEQRQ